MKKILTIAALVLSWSCYSQEYEVGAMTVKDFSMRTDGALYFGDSTFYLVINGNEEERKILQRSQSVTYISDGVATDKLTVSVMTGKIKGFSYDYTIVRDPDARFAGSNQVIYYCRKKP